MTSPYKHAALIKLWADGAVIERLGFGSGWFAMDAPGGKYMPTWSDDFEYRVKPKPQLSRTADALIHDLRLTAKSYQWNASNESSNQQKSFDEMEKSVNALRKYIISLENPE